MSLSLPVQILISSRNASRPHPEIMFYSLFGHPSAWSSQHVNFTITGFKEGDGSCGGWVLQSLLFPFGTVTPCFCFEGVSPHLFQSQSLVEMAPPQDQRGLFCLSGSAYSHSHHHHHLPHRRHHHSDGFRSGMYSGSQRMSRYLLGL